jgi:catalase
MVGNNTPIFFIRDPINFPDFIHTQKRNPQTNLPDANAFWDFASLVPETVHQFSFLFTDRGTPYSYRHMSGFSSHTFKWVNAEGAGHWIKLHYKSEVGIRTMTRQEAASSDADHATRDLFDHIAGGGEAAWRVYVQLMPEAKAADYKWNVFDVTKVWPHADYPLVEFGRMVLNRNPANYFAEVEQAAFSPGHLVPGIEPSLDRMLQGRLFSYPDTHRHRLGPNYLQIPINAPKNPVSNQQRDGFMCINGNQGAEPNYYPNSYSKTPEVDKHAEVKRYAVNDFAARFPQLHPNDDFEQPRAFYERVLSKEQRDNLISNIVAHLRNARKEIQDRQVAVFTKVSADYGARVAAGLEAEAKARQSA